MHDADAVLRVAQQRRSIVGIRAQRNSKKLTELDLSEGLRFIKGEAFRECLALHHVKIPSSATSLGPMSFYRCVKLMQVELCERLIVIEDKAFSRCRFLEPINISSTVRIIEKQAFAQCERLVSLDLVDGQLLCLGEESFRMCTSLERIRIPSTVNEIGDVHLMIAIG